MMSMARILGTNKMRKQINESQLKTKRSVPIKTGWVQGKLLIYFTMRLHLFNKPN